MTPTEPTTVPPLAARLRELRVAAGMKQAALATRAGVSRSEIAMLETGARGRRPSPAVLRRLAYALGVQLADLKGKE